MLFRSVELIHGAWYLACRRPHLFLDMRIVNEEGKVMPHDGKASGDLEVKGPIAVRQYFKVSCSPNRQGGAGPGRAGQGGSG